MRCTACGAANPDGARFCAQCAAPVAEALACASCGTLVVRDARFCHACAAPVSAPHGDTGGRIGMAAEGERKQVTVLFADVVGSMRLAAEMDTEEWSRLMERFFAVLRAGVNRFGGRIDKFTGDGVMALFGAPLAYEDHARRACAAALALMDDVAYLAAELEADRGIRFAVRMGLNSGEVVVGTVGSDLKAEYTAVGNTVGFAQRMESLAEPGTVRLTAATATLVRGFFEVRALGAVEVKGARGEVEVFELLGTGPARTPLEAAAARGFSPFVGRDRELAALEGALLDASAGNGQVVGIVAEPGVGKSRLCHEFAQRARAGGVEVFAAHALSDTSSVPFGPVLEMLRAQFGIVEQDDAAAARAKISAAVHALDASLGEAVHALLHDFLGVADPDRPAPAIDAEARQRQIFEALTALRRARTAPSVLLVEDLHWLDDGSRAFLENVVDGISGTRQLAVLTFRPEFRSPWAHRAHYAQVPLMPLRDDDRDRLVAGLLGSDPSLDGVAELVCDRTGGNPFFIEEVIQGLVEEGHLEGERGAHRLGGSIGEVHIPATVQAVLAARVDRLAPAEKALLQTASVMGRQFSRRVLGAVSALPAEAVDSALRAFVDAELVYRVSGYAEEAYVFKHALTEEVAYGSQLAPQRARTHAAVAAAMAAYEPERADERASLIARHHELGGDLLEAARWNARAAAWIGVANPLESVRHWQHVRRLTGRLTPSPEVAELAVNARVQLLVGFGRLGAAGEGDGGAVAYEHEARAVYDELDAVADATGQLAVKVLARMAFGVVRQLGDAVSEGVALNAEATKLSDEVGDPGLRSSARFAEAWGVFVLGQVRRASALAQEMVDIIGPDRTLGRGVIVASPYGWARMQLAHFGAYWQGLESGLRDLAAAIELLTEEGDLESRSWAYRHYAILADLAGVDADLAEAYAREAVRWADESGGTWTRGFNRSGLVASACQRGDLETATAVADEALAIIRPRRIGVADVPLLLAYRARAGIGRGDPAGALRDATEAVSVAVHCGTRFYEAQARHQLARALMSARARQAGAARDELERASAIVAELGINAYVPHLERDRDLLTDSTAQPG